MLFLCKFRAERENFNKVQRELLFLFCCGLNCAVLLFTLVVAESHAMIYVIGSMI